MPSTVIRAAKEFSKLSMIHLEAIIAWCRSAGKLGTKDILKIYEQYLSWRQGLSSELDTQVHDLDNSDVLPSVLLLQYIQLSCSL
jgi:hypothetical protein